MLLSRFWYGVIAIGFAVMTYVLFVAVQVHNRATFRSTSEALSADSSSVDWYLRDDARKRSSALIGFTLSNEIVNGLAKTTNDGKLDPETHQKTQTALRKLAEELPADTKFDAVWAVDAGGRVVAQFGFEHREDWDLGGYACVADALHGWIRDDAWLWKGRIYRVVARPIEKEAGGEPVGAIVGAKIVDDGLASAVSKRTGVAIAFYADGARVASASPEGFDRSSLDEITRDITLLGGDKDYQDKGRSNVRTLSDHLGVVYARLPGEAWDLGAGYAVGRLTAPIKSPFDFLNQADATDKAKAPVVPVIVGGVVLALLGVLLTFLEHNRPLNAFRKEALRFAKGEVDSLAPSKFRGAYREIASDLTDGIEKVVAKGGGARRAADLSAVLGPMPTQAQMSAFAVPGAAGFGNDARAAASAAATPRQPKVPSVPQAPQRGKAAIAEAIEAFAIPSATPEPAAPPAKPAAAPPAAPVAKPQLPPPVPTAARKEPEPEEEAPLSLVPESVAESFDELADWKQVFADFVALKEQCGEPTAGLTFDKFKGTLQRNKDALVARHNCEWVKFTVYAKDGKAALKASPVK